MALNGLLKRAGDSSIKAKDRASVIWQGTIKEVEVS